METGIPTSGGLRVCVVSRDLRMSPHYRRRSFETVTRLA